MSCEIDVCRFLRGSAHLKELSGSCSTSSCDQPSSILSWLGGNCPSTNKALDIGRNIGNVEVLDIFVEAERKGQSIYDSIFDTPCCSTVIINEIKINLTLTSSSRENLLFATYGSSSKTMVSGAEEINQYVCNGVSCGQYFQMPGPIDTATLTVSIFNALGDETILQPKEYSVLYADTIKLKNEYSDIVRIKFNFDYLSTTITTINHVNQEAKYHSLTFKGLNKVGGCSGEGQRHTIEIPKVMFLPSPVQNIQNIGDFYKIQLSGFIYKFQDGNGLDSYYKTVIY